MNFTAIPIGTSLFLDANTLVYHFAPNPNFGPPCQQLMERIARREVMGFTSAHVLTNVAHRLMTLEAVLTFGWPLTNIASRLKRRHSEISRLTRFRQAIDEIRQLGIRVIPIAEQDVVKAARLSQQYELLSGDALIVAVMQEHDLTHLASHDADFDRVPGLTRYAPG